jgi:hypothetical protein
MRVSIATALVAGAAAVFAGCGSEVADAPVAVPSSGTAYRALNESERLAVAAGCRDRAAARAHGVAADELRRVDALALREQLDAAFRLITEQRRPVAELCAERLPFVTPGLRLTFEGAKQGGDEFTYLTSSEKPLTIRGAVSPTPPRGVVAVRRAYERSTTHRTRIGADGSFTLPTMRLRKMANNSFIVAIHAPPSAIRKVYFSAICLDCLAGAPPPSSPPTRDVEGSR